MRDLFVRNVFYFMYLCAIMSLIFTACIYVFYFMCNILRGFL